jgi:foldase protein PrsA
MKYASRLLAAFVVVALLAVVTGCTGQNAATVNGQGIPLSEVKVQLEAAKTQYPQMFQGADAATRGRDIAKRLVDNLVDEKLVADAAAKMGVTITDAQVEKQLGQIRGQFKDQAAFDEALKKFGTTLEKLKAQLKNQLLLQGVQAKLSSSQTVSEKEIKAYYDKNKSQFKQTAAKRVSQILVAAKDQALAGNLSTQLKSGANFAALAKKYSIDKGSAVNGGDLGWPTTPYVPEFQAAVDKLTKTGQMSAPVKSTYGWHIIKLDATRPAEQKTLAQATAQIKQILIQQRKADAYQAFVAKLRKEAKIEIDQKAIDQIIAGTSK